MPIDLDRAKDYIQGQNKKHLAAAQEYAKTCAEYGEVLNNYQRMLAKRVMIYRAERKNLGVEMAQLMALADMEWPERDEFSKISERLNYLEYLRRGLEPVLEAYKSEIMSIMSLFKYQSEGERYGG